MKKLILLLVFGLLVVACGRPSSVPKVEGPVVATPPPTQEPFSSSKAKFVGLPPDEVQRLREQCLQANSNSLCVPFPVDPNAARAYFQEFSDWSQLVILGPVGLEFRAPCDGVVIWRRDAESDVFWCPKISCGLTREEWEVMHQPEYWPFGTKMGEPEFWRQRPEVEPWIHRSNCFTEKEFESFVKARGGRKQYSEWFDRVEIHLGEVFFALKTAEKPGTQKGQIVVTIHIRELQEEDGEKWLSGESYDMTEADFLHDSEGRIVYVKP